ncbi:MAG TPA: cytochrome c biogenesis protein CcsA [Bacteroidia bacterium]|nr:cytochrome c biogenesis protein CcsA [Bacteroidia bacterium]
MDNIQYIGEHLGWGRAGNFFVVLAFTSSLLSCVSYFLGIKNSGESNGWKLTARAAFYVHALSVFSIIGILFYLIFNHYFEYYYVWQHSNTVMPVKYIFSCFWEGQEGSFLLWMFWQVVISFVIIRQRDGWEIPAMSVIMAVQVFLSSMILGVYVLGYKIGSNPFILLREHPDFVNLPFVKLPDYLSKITDGRGLNPLLQNYWMVIHPPTLFLGFAATVVPFAYALGSLMNRRTTEWIKPVMPWTFFSLMVLGTGVLMGAAWAYESLSFGGFWAWDPVENASLVPWITLAAASHVMMIYNHKGHSLFTVYFLTIITFLLVLYSTFLTRSGILGDTSVHAFTDLGMSGQLVLYMAFFVVLAIVLLIRERKKIILKHDDESVFSREFWMYIGALVLIISSLQITFTTSIPVINKIFGTNLAPPADAVSHYNAWQIPIAIIITLLIAVGQFLKFKKTDTDDFLKKMFVSLLITIVGTIIGTLMLHKQNIFYSLMMFSTLFAVTANADYFLRILKGNFQKAGASTAHIGFALILLGALVSNSQKQIISNNVKGVNLGNDFPNNENILIEQQTDTLPMGEYFVCYKGKVREGVNQIYTIEYFRQNPSTGLMEKKFELHPVVQLNERMGNVSEPSTRHFISRDIYTHITYAQREDLQQGAPSEEEYQKPVTHLIAIGDTISTSSTLVVLTGLNKNIDKSSLGLSAKDLAVGAVLRVTDINFNRYNVEPVYIIKDMSSLSRDAVLDTLGLKFNFTRIDPEQGKMEILVSEKKSNKKEFIIMKAIVFPGINILWTGCVIFIFGMVLTIRKRIRKLRESRAQ